jgi:DNA mismatch repair protein MutL
VNRIHLLSEQVANQIAAGEVVERPASVVKELVENALDAGATRIVVEVGAGGRALIRVTDDGCGMSRDDALLCLERHATSKIRRAEDLESVRSMGFRGEAIPSIASVSRFSLTTRERDETVGEATQVLIQGGKISDVRVAASPPGTAVEVRQLFFNLPARRKFLRSEETERSHIQHYVGLAALAHPGVAFALICDGRTVLEFPRQPWSRDEERLPALKERLRQFHGADATLLPVDFETELDGNQSVFESSDTGEESTLGTPPNGALRTNRLRVWGFIGAPGVSRSTRDSQHLFVNQRPVENRGLNFALIEGYHTALMKGQYPVCCLFLEIDPALVDVNIHPQKREIKFRDEARVRRCVSQAVRDTLLKFHHGPTGAIPTSARPTSEAPIPSSPSGLKLWPTTTPHPARSNPTTSIPSTPTPPPTPTPAPTSTSTSTAPPFAFTPRDPSPRSAPPEATSQEPGEVPPLEPEPTELVASGERPAVAVLPREASSSAANGIPRLPPPEPVPLLRMPLRLVGVVGRLYVVFESDRGMVLMDQHAAHERILFEQMLHRLERTEEAPSQKLLLPETVELAPRDAEFLRRHLSVLSRLGVGLREFGDRTFLLDALPPFVKNVQPRPFIFELIDQLKLAGTGVNNLRLGEDVVAKTVCRHAVKANDPLAPRELEQLAEDLRRCSMPYTCPHGRPTLIEMNWRELEKKFGRTG